MSCSTCPAKAILDIKQNSPENNAIDCGKLSSYDWLKEIPKDYYKSKLVEVRFKNTRKEFYLNKNDLLLKIGAYVAVESDRGHDIGQITLLGRMAEMQLKRKKPKLPPERKVYRIASKTDLEKWQMAKLREKPVLVKARQLANSLNLEMKISDVEFQGDASRATFYYIADGRVDFRELIKRYAREFSVRIEMRQIGSRQEAAMVGGIGSCGKELCCSSWRINLDTVLTSAARIQELPHNAQKLTGQCGKLKCCLMYELDSYLDAQEDFPDMLLELETEKGVAYPRKKDILKKIVYYAIGEENFSNLIPVPLDRIKEVIQLNKKGVKVDSLIQDEFQNLGFTNKNNDETAPLQQVPHHKRKNKRRKNKKRTYKPKQKQN